MEYYGFKGITLEWFKSYLNNRKQIVRYQSCDSEYKHINCGVPQGSILGPLLLILNVNDFVATTSLFDIHTLRVHYAHAAANLNSGYSKYAKVARVHYFCTIALRTSRAVLTQRERRVGLIYASVGLIYFLNGQLYYVSHIWMTFKLTKMSCLSHNKKQKVCLRRVWIRLTTAYLLYAREFRQNNALALQFWCLANALTLRFRALDASKFQRECIVLSKFTRKSKYAVINL